MHCVRIALLPILLAAGQARALDTDLWTRLLQAHTVATDDIASTRVDYEALRRSADWTRLIQSLRATRPERLGTGDARLAFWINAYNLLAIDMVVRHRPEESIKDIGSLFSSVWKQPAGVIGGRRYSLGEIEHEVLRPMSDPRIHAAIVCASLSCPPLRREAYVEARVDTQLSEQIRDFVRDPRKGVRIDRERRRIRISPIFDWFEDDFGGRTGVLRTIAAALPAEDGDWLRANIDGVRVRYFDYDWSLNGTE